MRNEETEQMLLDFKGTGVEPGETEDAGREAGPAKKPGALWNGTIWASDDDLPF